MARISRDRVVTAIDIGTTKICVLIARIIHNEQIEIIGIGKTPSKGLKKGIVVNISDTICSIQAALKEAELMAEVQVESAYIGVAGSHITSKNSSGMVPVAKQDVRISDIQAVLAAAQAILIPEGQRILHVLSQYYILDNNERVIDPLGMHAVRLEVAAHIILGAVASLENLATCCREAGVEVSDIVLEQLASADAVLIEDEKKLGVAVLDIGGGTSDFVVYQNEAIRHTMVLPVAGNHFTHDVAIGLRVPIADAEEIKKVYGKLYLDDNPGEILFEVGTMEAETTQIIAQPELVAILEPRARELFQIIKQEITEHNLMPFMQTGLVLTGGGSQLNGMQRLAQEIVGVPVRIGDPSVIYDMPSSLRKPMYATSYGLLIHALKKQQQGGRMPQTMMHNTFERMKIWVANFF